MDREEAKEELKDFKDAIEELESKFPIKNPANEKTITALSLAIIALSQKSCNDCIYYQDDLDTCRHTEPCEDAISRQAVLEGLASIAKAKAKSDAQKSLMGRVMFFTEQLPSVSTENPNRCDLISREWLKTAIHNFYYGLQHTPTEEDIQAYIDAAPSVSTEKTGRWIFDERIDKHYYCSECKAIGVDYFDYCPYCGAKMEVEE